MEFAYDGGGLGKGGDVTLFYDGKAVGTGRVEYTQAMGFSADETTDVGYESGTDRGIGADAREAAGSRKIEWVQIDLGDDTKDHLIDPGGAPEDRHGAPVGRLSGRRPLGIPGWPGWPAPGALESGQNG